MTATRDIAMDPQKPRRTRLYAVLGAVGLAVLIALVYASRSKSPDQVSPVAGSATAGESRKPAEGAPAATTGAPKAEASNSVSLPPASAGENPIEAVPATLDRLAADIQVIGNVSYDADHFAIVGPLVPGRVARLAVGVGDRVNRGQIMAEIESAEVGEARAALLSAKARAAAAETNLKRERELAEKRISSAREREMAEAQYATERAALRAAHERLRAIGLTPADFQAMEEKELGGRVPMRAPISGTVIERMVTLGEAVERAKDAFKIANLAQVWVLLDLYEKDLARVHVGQSVEIRTDAYPGEVFRARVAYVTPVIDEGTRTAKVRVEVDNGQGKLRLGQLVSAKLIGDPNQVTTPVVTVPRSAVQRIDGRPLVFVKNGNGFERRLVELGVSGNDRVEIRQGLKAGELIASDGAFLLKSELLR